MDTCSDVGSCKTTFFWRGSFAHDQRETGIAGPRESSSQDTGRIVRIVLTGVHKPPRVYAAGAVGDTASLSGMRQRFFLAPAMIPCRMSISTRRGGFASGWPACAPVSAPTRMNSCRLKSTPTPSAASASRHRPRALFGGAEHIERIDSLARRSAGQRGLECAALAEIVARVDDRLGKNRAKHEQPAAPVFGFEAMPSMA
jgi:hypothetical protein